MGSFNSSLFPQINALDFAQHSQTSFNSFAPNAPFLYPLKTSKNLGSKSVKRASDFQNNHYVKSVFCGPNFPVFGLNTVKYAPKKTPYLDTFQTVSLSVIKISSVSESVRNILDFNNFAKTGKLQRKLQENFNIDK